MSRRSMFLEGKGGRSKDLFIQGITISVDMAEVHDSEFRAGEPSSVTSMSPSFVFVENQDS